jgi:hypothetical protein
VVSGQFRAPTNFLPYEVPSVLIEQKESFGEGKSLALAGNPTKTF